MTYDAAVHHAVVTVADNAGTLQASVAYDGTNVTKPSFTNTYEAQATDSGAIALTKSVDVHDGSYQLKAGDFAFELVGSDGSVIQTQKNDAHGKVAFDKLTFDHAGTFIYTVREVQPTDDAPGVPGVTYTGKTYTLTYVVADNNDGKLVWRAPRRSERGHRERRNPQHHDVCEQLPAARDLLPDFRHQGA